MTKIDTQKTPKPASPDKGEIETDAKPETEEEKIKREQATKPALMPIGDPAGAA